MEPNGDEVERVRHPKAYKKGKGGLFYRLIGGMCLYE